MANKNTNRRERDSTDINSSNECLSEISNYSSDVLTDTMSTTSGENFFSNPELEFEIFSTRIDQTLETLKGEMKNYISSQSKAILSNANDQVSALNSEKLAAQQRCVKLKSELILLQSEKDMLIQNKIKLKQEILDMSEELGDILEELPQLKADAKEKIMGMKETYNSYNYALKYYQKFLNIYIDVETLEPLLFKIYFFTSNANNKDYSITIQKNIDKKWILMNSSPKLPDTQFTVLREKLSANNSLNLLVCSVRKLFLQETKDKENKCTNV